jgi:NADPH2:quinone reductase
MRGPGIRRGRCGDVSCKFEGARQGGTVVSFGRAFGPPPGIDPSQLTGSCTRVAGGSVFTYVTDPAELQQRAAAVVGGIRAGWLRMGDGTPFDLDRASDAHRAIEARGTKGKLYLMP